MKVVIEQDLLSTKECTGCRFSPDTHGDYREQCFFGYWRGSENWDYNLRRRVRPQRCVEEHGE